MAASLHAAVAPARPARQPPAAASEREAVPHRPQAGAQRSGIAGSGAGSGPGNGDDRLWGPGQPLDPAIRAPMERRLGHSFGAVRLHTDARAAASARALDAAAYTVGPAIVFGHGRFRPDTPGGRAILAHELAHVAQQSRGGTCPPGAAQEREANDVATRPHGGPPVRAHSAVGLARLSVADVERGLWARVPDVVKPYVRPLAKEAKAELDKIVPPTTEIPAAAVEAATHPVQAVQAAAATVTTAVKAAVPSPSKAVQAAKQRAKAAIRDHAMELAGEAKGVVLEAATIVDTLAWIPYAGHQALSAAVGGNKLGQQALALGEDLTGYTAQRAFAERHGLIDPQTGAPSVAGRLSSGIDTLVDKGAAAAFGDLPPEEAMFLTAYEQGELKGAIGTQVGLAFVGVEEVQLALKVVGALGSAKGIYDSVKRNPGGWYKSPDFWASVIGLGMSVLGLGASKSRKKIVSILLRSGAVLNAVPAIWKLVQDYEDPTLSASPGGREKVLKADIVAITKILANAIADAMREGAARGAGKGGPSAAGTEAPAIVEAAPVTAQAEAAGPVTATAPPPAPAPLGSLKPLTAPLRLPVIEGAGPVPQGLQPGAIGTYGKGVPAPHPFALESNPVGAPGGARAGGRMPQTGREAAGVYAEHQTPAAVAHEVLDNHELHGPQGQRREGRDTQEALTISFPKAAKGMKDRADAALLRDVRARKAAGESVAPIEVIARGAQHSLDATAQPGVQVPQEQITKAFMAEQDQFFRERHNYTEVRPGEAPPPGAPALPSTAEFDAHLDQAFAPFVEPSAGERMVGGGGKGGGGGEPPVDTHVPPSPAHGEWTEGTKQSGLGVRPPPLPQPGAAPLRVGHVQRGITTMAEALRTYDEFRARAPGREIGIYMHSLTGEYAVTAGQEGSVSAPHDTGPGRWTNVVHNHPNRANVLSYRNPSPQDVGNLARTALLERRVVTAFIEHEVPEGGRRYTAVTVAPLPPTGDGPMRFDIRLDWSGPKGRAEPTVFHSLEEYEQQWGARAVYAEPGSREYDDYMRSAEQEIRRRRNDD